MRRHLSLTLLILLCAGPAVGSPVPLPVRAVERAAVEPFPGGGAVPAHRQTAGAPGTAAGPEDLAFDTATAPGPGVQRVLGEVGDDPQAAYRWVRDRVEFEPYHGVKRGAEGVAWERVGNDFDQAALLAALLRSQGVACRFVYGVVRVPATRFAAWSGVATEEEAYRLAVRGGVPVRALRVGGRIQAVEVNHCWLEAYLPYGNPGYRGAGERVWVALDPSYKAHEVALGIDLFPRLGFQEEEFLADYLATPHEVSPETHLRDVLRDKLRELGAVGGLAQAAVRIAVVPEGPGELPTDLPPDLEMLGVVWERATVPDVYQYRLRLTLWDGVDDGRGVTPGDLRVEIPTTVLAHGSLALVYRPAGAEDQALIDASPTRSPGDPTIRSRLRWKPVLLVDGRPVGEVLPGELTEAAAPGPAEGGNLGTTQTLLVETLYAGRDPAAVDQPPNLPGSPFGYAQARLAVGEAYALAVEVGLVTAEQMAYRAATLRAQQEEGGAEGVITATLSVAALQYLHRTGLAARSFGRLLGVRSLREPSLVLCGVHRGAGDPFFDAIGLVSAVVSRDGRADRERAFLCLWGLESSYQEHKVLEDVFRTSAVSTVRILKRSRELGLPPVLVDRSTVDAEAWRLLALGPEGERVRNEVMEGRKVLLAPEPVTLEHWSGTGYLVWDPETWYAGYLIRGGRAGGNLSGTVPSYLLRLVQWLAPDGSEFTVIHSVWGDPDHPDDLHAEVTYVPVEGLHDTVLASVVVLPADYPREALGVEGLGSPALRRLPAVFLVDQPTPFQPVALCVEPAEPAELRPRTAVLGAASTTELRASTITWTAPDGTLELTPASDGTALVGVPWAGRATLKVEVTAPGGAAAAYATVMTSEAARALAEPALDGVPVLVGPPDALGNVLYGPDAAGVLVLSFAERGDWGLAPELTPVGVVSAEGEVSHTISDLSRPGWYDVLYTEEDGVLRRASLLLLHLALGVDGNRDGDVDPEDAMDQNLLFWVNDDDDVLISADDPWEPGVERDNDPALSVSDASDDAIDCLRDLEDFTRLQLWVDAGGRFPAGMSLLLSFETVSGTTPVMNVFPAVSCTLDYQASLDTARLQLGQTRVAAVGATPTLLKGSRVQPDGSASCFLAEGSAPGLGVLTLAAVAGGRRVATAALRVDLRDISSFYDTFTVDSRGGDDVTAEATEGSSNGRYAPASDEYVLFVHGATLEEWERERWAETTFKRLWWNRYRGAVGLFSWPTTAASLNPQWFDHAELRAWRSAAALKDVLLELRGRPGSTYRTPR